MRENRLSRMERFIRENRSVDLETLCREFDVSINTVRRDIAELARRTDIRKIYGGVRAPSADGVPPPFNERSLVNREVKERIGRRAAQFVNDGDIIYVDSGTTTCQLIDHLRGRKGLTVLTHSLDVINRAVANPEINIVSLSGALNRKTFSFTGHHTIDALADCNISKAFMSGNGVTLRHGVMQSTPIEFAIKKTVVAHSDQVYLMVENRKFGMVSLLTYCQLDQVNVIITEAQPDQAFVDAYAGLGGLIVAAGPDS